MKKLPLLLLFLLFVTVAYAVDSTKPTYHNTDWIEKHGQAAKANEAEFTF